MKNLSNIFSAFSYVFALVLCLSLASCAGEGPNVPVSSVYLDYDALRLYVGETAILKAMVSPYNADNQNVSWSSENPDIASVTDGVVSALAEGQTTIVVVTEDGGKKATCNLTVKADPNDIVDEELLASDAYDLSSEGTANCYVVTNPGVYKFKAVRGNEETLLEEMDGCAVLWESFGTSVAPSPGDLIRQVGFENGYVLFKTTDVFKKGNAVIAAMDADGNLLWSWHIWITDAPKGQVYFNDAGVMMDRNLGALSATPGKVGAFGLMYQWGRKDPFLGSSSIAVPVKAKSSVAFPPAVSSDDTVGTIEYTISHPTTFITGHSGWDWYWYSEGSDTRWTTSESPKSLYDPCPAGWRVPDGGYEGFWVKAAAGHDGFYVASDESLKGTNLSGWFGEDETIWYPKAGLLDHATAEVVTVGLYGAFWAAGVSSIVSHCLFIEYDDIIEPVSTIGRAYGCNVRCVQE